MFNQKYSEVVSYYIDWNSYSSKVLKVNFCLPWPSIDYIQKDQGTLENILKFSIWSIVWPFIYTVQMSILYTVSKV